MTMHDPISDMLTRIRNGQVANKISVKMPFSKLKIAISNVLKEEGYIESYSSIVDKKRKPIMELFLKYFRGKPVIDKIIRVSSPKLRVYRKKNKLPKIMSGLGISIVSTSKGIITGKQACKFGVGGEILCYVT
ncbi:30S ribosomal protein S8 [Buchnera aphidicola (Tetraneura ulmi)]|uniref:30S ribosomal protein S8 n=1 Tax=Buchnera aphidicola TaxID=9 RepID=UPI003463C452